MKQLLIYTISFLLLAGNTLMAQDSYYGPLFQTVIANNPAYAGSEGDGVVRSLYMNHYPGNNYNLHSVYLS